MAALAALLPLGSCLQGPWDYYPDNPPPVFGITAHAYAIADRPLENVCFEKLLRLTEEPTDAFPFYDSAEVRITGKFSDGFRTQALTPVDTMPNCFRGDSAALVERGGSYDMTAFFAWDSAGTPATHTLTALARVPASFTMKDSANAPSLARVGGVPANVLTEEFIRTLPPAVSLTLFAEFGDSIQAYRSDSAALNGYLTRNGKVIQERLFELLQGDETTYASGDSLFYLNGALNTLSHFYDSDRSGDVAAVLITHRYDPRTGRAGNVFSNFFGEPDTSDFYFPGDRRRLRLYGNFRLSGGGYQLDNLGVINVWFHMGLNRLYFYGLEQAYYDFITTAQEGEEDARIDAKYNVTGGRGFFVGAVVDSFDVYIKADSLTPVYPMAAARAGSCREDGWFSNEDCRSFYRPHCLQQGWKDQDCRPDAVRASLEVSLRPDSVLAAALDSSGNLDSALADTGATRLGRTQFCIENAFPAQGGECDDLREACLVEKASNECKSSLWDFCKENLWRTDECKGAMVSYCRDKPGRSRVLCARADDYCRDNPGEAQCR